MGTKRVNEKALRIDEEGEYNTTQKFWELGVSWGGLNRGRGLKGASVYCTIQHV